MSVNALVSLEEYLDTAYSPDREYVDGAVVERNLGEKPHSRVQSNIVMALRQRPPELFVWPEQRVRTAATRSRVPDVCVTIEEPPEDVFVTPPFIAIEILSRRDEMSDVLEKLEEYEAFGVPHIWLFDPRRKKVFTYREDCLEEVTRGVLEAAAPLVRLTVEEVFRGL